MKFYTWKDIDRYILMLTKIGKILLTILKYIPMKLSCIPGKRHQIQHILHQHILHQQNCFQKTFCPGCSAIKLDCPNASLSVSYDFESSPISPNIMPLFKKAIYEDSVYPKNNLKELSRPVIAFHSYKGGVGRTLSLIAFAQAWTSIQDESTEK